MASISTVRYQGRLELTWTNKDKTLLSTADGKYDYTFVDPTDYRVSEVRLLHEVDRIEGPEPEDRPADLPTPTSGNLLITGDAMHVLDALAKIPEYAEKYLERVKLVYIGPTIQHRPGVRALRGQHRAFDLAHASAGSTPPDQTAPCEQWLGLGAPGRRRGPPMPDSARRGIRSGELRGRGCVAQAHLCGQ